MNGLISIGDLAEIVEEFFIPSYQRGYRWQAEKEVLALLNDLLEFFSTKTHNESNFYCLQPLVVKKENNAYNVLDGQQRLTTIFLIYKVLFENKNMFSIAYETRPKSKEFLTTIENQLEANKDDNIDFFHMYEAYKGILDWFEQDDSLNKKDLFLKYFLTKSKVIWYEVDKNEKEIEVFLRLNIGKIHLTNAELIKALFLSKSEDEDSDDLKERAEVWYSCEISTRAKNDKVYCLYNNPQSADIQKIDNEKTLSDDITRVEMYFALLSGTTNSKSNPQAIFAYYDNLLKQKSRQEVWEDFEQCQGALISFANPQPNDYEARRLYHYLGFLVEIEKYTAKDLWYEIQNSTQRHEIVSNLKQIIIDRYKNVSLSNLSYGKDAPILKNLLLLLNLEDLNTREGVQKDFEFNRYKLQQWSLEHIIPQKLKNRTDFDKIKPWLDDLRNFRDDDELIAVIDKMTEQNFKDNIEKIESLLEYYTDIHSISNLVLLDKDSNASLSNDSFDAKRKKIKDLETANRLIPQCTGAVFNKHYSEENGNPTIWTSSDRDAYFQEIEKLLADYIGA